VLPEVKAKEAEERRRAEEERAKLQELLKASRDALGGRARGGGGRLLD
jgi:hypothetical protein